MNICVKHSTIFHFADNRLSLNTDKTEFLIFRPPRSNNQRLTLLLNRTTIFESNKIRYLGLILCNKLNWKSHVTQNYL